MDVEGARPQSRPALRFPVCSAQPAVLEGVCRPTSGRTGRMLRSTNWFSLQIHVFFFRNETKHGGFDPMPGCSCSSLAPDGRARERPSPTGTARHDPSGTAIGLPQTDPLAPPPQLISIYGSPRRVVSGNGFGMGFGALETHLDPWPKSARNARRTLWWFWGGFKT